MLPAKSSHSSRPWSAFPFSGPSSIEPPSNPVKQTSWSRGGFVLYLIRSRNAFRNVPFHSLLLCDVSPFLITNCGDGGFVLKNRLRGQQRSTAVNERSTHHPENHAAEGQQTDSRKRDQHESDNDPFGNPHRVALPRLVFNEIFHTSPRDWFLSPRRQLYRRDPKKSAEKWRPLR